MNPKRKQIGLAVSAIVGGGTIRTVWNKKDLQVNHALFVQKVLTWTYLEKNDEQILYKPTSRECRKQSLKDLLS